MHGHVKIELTDVKSGKKEIYEHDNLITNWVKNMGVPCGEAGSAPISWISPQNANTPTVNNTAIDEIFGGLIGWSDVLEESADTKLPPISNNATCRGTTLVTASQTDNTCGTNNATLSGYINNGTGYKYVYDFTQEQGNGTISALSLCNKYFGKGGWKDSSSFSANSFTPFLPTIDRNRFITNFSIYQAYLHSDYILMIDYYNMNYKTDTDDHKARHISQCNKIRLKKYKWNAGTNKSLTRLDKYPQSIIGNDTVPDETTEVSLPSGFPSSLLTASNMFFSSCYDDEYIYIFFSASEKISNGTVLYCVKIKVSDYSSELLTVTYSFSNPIYFSVDNVDNYRSVHVLNGYFISSYGRIKLSDNADAIMWKTKKDGTSITAFDMFSACLVRPEMALIVRDSIGYSPYGIAPNDMMIADLSSGKVRSSNGIRVFGKKIVNSVMQYAYCRYTDTYLLCYPGCFLATINNLETPVTKTADKTMRITYTLSFS